MIRRRKRPAEDSTIDITPMLDIVFIMLIFFIVTTTFIKETGYWGTAANQCCLADFYLYIMHRPTFEKIAKLQFYKSNSFFYNKVSAQIPSACRARIRSYFHFPAFGLTTDAQIALNLPYSNLAFIVVNEHLHFSLKFRLEKDLFRISRTTF